MTPTRYVEKVPTFTAAQWDGSDEARDWITLIYADAAQLVDEDIVIAGPVHTVPLERGTWIVREDHEGAPPQQYDEYAFGRQFALTTGT